MERASVAKLRDRVWSATIGAPRRREGARTRGSALFAGFAPVAAADATKAPLSFARSAPPRRRKCPMRMTMTRRMASGRRWTTTPPARVKPTTRGCRHLGSARWAVQGGERQGTHGGGAAVDANPQGGCGARGARALILAPMLVIKWSNVSSGCGLIRSDVFANASGLSALSSLP